MMQTYTITIDTREKSGVVKPVRRKVKGYILDHCDNLLAVHERDKDQDDYKQRPWSITHLPTGLRVCVCRSERMARFIATQLHYAVGKRALELTDKDDVVEAFEKAAPCVHLYVMEASRGKGLLTYQEFARDNAAEIAEKHKPYLKLLRKRRKEAQCRKTKSRSRSSSM